MLFSHFIQYILWQFVKVTSCHGILMLYILCNFCLSRNMVTFNISVIRHYMTCSSQNHININMTIYYTRVIIIVHFVEEIQFFFIARRKITC